MSNKLIFASLLTVSLSASAAVPYNLGVAGYTFHKKNIDQALEIMQRADIHYLCVKDFHLPYTADDAAIAAFKAKCAKAGVTPYALGPLYTKDVAQLRPYFAFAKRFGVKTIVGVPYDPTDEKDSWGKRKGSRKQLDAIDALVKEFDIRYAIHNHGPQSPDMYPDVAYGWNLVKDLDPRIGFCLDVGWEYSCRHDPCETIRAHAARIFDVHVKNFAVGQKDGYSSPLPRGKLDFAKIFKTLADVGYAGVCAIEYERDFDDNLAPIAECAGYFHGVADMIHAKAVLAPVPAGANTLSAAEKAEGWQLLFDGRNVPKDLWVGANKEWGFKTFPTRGWYVQQGFLAMRAKNAIANGQWVPLPAEDQKLAGGGDIVTVKKYRDFAFSFDFRLTEAANSGVKYFYNEGVNQSSCEEYQILDKGHPDYDKSNPGGVPRVHRLAGLYDLIEAPEAEKVVKPLGQWNRGLIVAKGNTVEHWLNGVKVLTYERGSEAFRKAVASSKYFAWQDKGQHWGEAPEGRILLQDHTDSSVSFCNLKIREL